ncbi:MAG: 1-(5-phosphoribosyl)-5-((5-phosphoribosylamino)methylideneamino)imidazole-4-carboxamide isomerase [Myxococcales bacterium]|nr:1-(5-phosphoribosyl)-5-((5-phosphoribosylamino)methylideneamino)imidazole-4-carboxamide isomerase [Myxococcales bacterium]
MKLFAAIDLLGGRVVRLHQGDYDRVTTYSTDPLAVIEGFVEAGARHLHIVDLDGARDGAATQAPTLAKLLRRAGDALEVQVGGGIRTEAQALAYRDAGARRVIVGTRAVEDPEFVAKLAGAVDVVVAVDAREGRVATHGWRHTSEVRAVDLAARVALAGARAVLYTDIARDGTGEGPNLDTTLALARAVPSLEVLASGGVGRLGHLDAIAQLPEIAGVVVGRALYDGRVSLGEALRRAGRATTLGR